MADLRPEEIAFLTSSERCEVCGHLQALHNRHCCEFCKIPGCKCEWGEMREDG